MVQHHIVEDIEQEYYQDESEHAFFYLKQMKFLTYKEFVFAREYYNKIKDYCYTRCRNQAIVNLNQVYDFENQLDNYYEIVIIYDFGETDRIDVELIENHHINLFLNNVCILLKDIFKFNKITHNNLNLSNIIYVNGQIQISGFKPLFLEDESKIGWKYEFGRKFGLRRLDVYLIGLLWLKFLNLPIEDLIKEEYTFKKVEKNINQLLEQVKSRITMKIVFKLLNVQKYSYIDIDEIINVFNENKVLQSIQQAKLEKEMKKIEQQNQKQTKPSNIFNHALRESEANIEEVDDENLVAEYKKTQNNKEFHFTGEGTLQNENAQENVERNNQFDNLIEIEDLNEEGHIFQQINQLADGIKIDSPNIVTRKSLDYQTAQILSKISKQQKKNRSSLQTFKPVKQENKSIFSELKKAKTKMDEVEQKPRKLSLIENLSEEDSRSDSKDFEDLFCSKSKEMTKVDSDFHKILNLNEKQLKEMKDKNDEQNFEGVTIQSDNSSQNVQSQDKVGSVMSFEKIQEVKDHRQDQEREEQTKFQIQNNIKEVQNVFPNSESKEEDEVQKLIKLNLAPTFRNDFEVDEDLKQNFKGQGDNSSEDKEMIQIQDMSKKQRKVVQETPVNQIQSGNKEQNNQP